MDMGGNWTRAALVSENGEMLWKERVPTSADDGREEIIGRALALLERGTSHAGARKIAGLGLALAGPVDPDTGLLYAPPNLIALDGVSFKALWEKRFGVPIYVGNDATLAALGEYRYGMGMGARVLFYITLSTGIGGGIVIDGQPMAGAYGMAGEVGHMTIDRRGPRCKCGNVGCLEAIASGTAIAETAKSLVLAGESPNLKDMVSGDLGRISSELVFDAARAGDVGAKDLLDDVAQAVGAGLVNILHLLNPDVIVVGGGVSQNWDYLWPVVDSYIQSHTMVHIKKLGFKVEVTTFGDDVGLMGAAALVWNS